MPRVRKKKRTPRKCAQCGTRDIPENEDFCSDECAWAYDEILQIMRQEGHYDDA